jgi:hypothetical protein
MCCIDLVMHFIGKRMVYKPASHYITTLNTTQRELIPSDYKHWIIACKMKHLITNLVVCELLLTWFFGEINDTWYNLTSTVTPYPFPYPYSSVLLHEPWPHGNHICIHINVDVLHQCQVVVHADWGYTLPYPNEYAKSNLHPCAFNVHCVQLLHHHAWSGTPHPTLVTELDST